MSDLIRHYSSIFGSFWLILYLLGSFFSMSNEFFVDCEGNHFLVKMQQRILIYELF